MKTDSVNQELVNEILDEVLTDSLLLEVTEVIESKLRGLIPAELIGPCRSDTMVSLAMRSCAVQLSEVPGYATEKYSAKSRRKLIIEGASIISRGAVEDFCTNFDFDTGKLKK